MRDTSASRQLWLTLAALGLVTGLALWSAWPIYATPRMVLAGVVGVTIGIGSALLGRARAWSAWAGAGIAVAGFVLAAVPLASPGSMGSPAAIGRGVMEVLAAAVLDWRRLLTISIPVADYQTLLVPFLVVMIGCSWAAVTLSFARGRLWTLAVLPMLGMVAFGAVFGSATAGRTVTVGPLILPAATQVALAGASLLVCGAWLIWRARLDRSDALRVARSQSATVRAGGTSLALAVRRRLGAYGLIGAAALGGLAFVPVTDMLGAREALRDSVLPPEVISAQTSPLTVYRGWFADGLHDEALLTVEGDVSGQRLRFATLDSYDGQTFHIDPLSAEFARQPTTQARSITVTIGSAYTGIWVPIVTAEGGAPTFTGARAGALTDSYYADASLGTAVVVPSADEPGLGLLPGDTYTIAASDAASAGALETVSGGEPTVSDEQYPALAAWVEQQGLGRTGADLAELVSRLRERGYLSHAAREEGSQAWISDLSSRAPYTFEPVRAGHTAARVDALFQNLLEQELRVGTGADEAALVAAVGDDEQFAAAGAVLANYLGFDARVVVGVRLGGADPADGVPACDSVCTGANVSAWVEVRVGEGAWAPLDVTPQFVSPPTRIRQGESLPENPTEVDEPSSEVIEPPSAQRDEATSETSATEPDAQDAPAVVEAILVALTLALALALLLAPLAVLPVAKALRRRWRRQAQAEVSMVGAWEELVDAYVDAGFEVPERLTRGELADLVDREAALVAAYAVDSAVFAEHAPTLEERDALWRLVDDERRQLTAEMRLRQRLGARLSPASLVRRARGDKAASPLLAHPGRRSDAAR